MATTRLKRDFLLLNAGHARHNADWNWKNVYSPFARIHFVKNGTAKIVRKDGIIALKKDHLYLTPSYMRHQYECDNILELYYIHIFEDSGKSLSIFDMVEFPVEVPAEDLDISLIQRLLEINPNLSLKHYDPSSYDNSSAIADSIGLRQNSPYACEMETQGILKQLISRFLAQASFKKEHTEERILKSLHYIHQHIDTPIDIERLAEMCFLTKDHFIRIFKKEMNCTPGKYINEKKIAAAQLRLLVQDMSVKDVSYSLGFDNAAYFNRLFKKITGESPGAYKRRGKRV